MSFDSDGNGDAGKRGTGSPPGSMIGVGIAIGTGFGVALVLVFDNLALGIAIGAAIGVAIGAAMEQNRRNAKAESHGTSRRQAWVLLGLGLTLFLGLVVAIVFLRSR